MDVFIEDLKTFLRTALHEDSTFQTPLPISVTLSVTDSKLVPLAKLGFSKLPLPIQNILLAMVEFESAKYKAVEANLSRKFQHLLSEVDTILALLRRCTESLQRTQEDLLAHARPLWYVDLRSLGDPFSGETPWASFQEAFEKCRKEELQRDAPAEILEAEPDLSTVHARLELSRAYRQKADNLLKRNFEKVSFPEIPGTTDAPVQMKQTSKPAQDQCMPLETLRKEAFRLWAPYKLSMQTVLSKEALLTTAQIRAAIDSIQLLKTTPPVLQSNDLLDEYKFAIQTFPCDVSMVKTCLTVSLDGCKLGHTRKLLELKSEFTTQFQVRCKQYRDAVAAYHETCTIPLV